MESGTNETDGEDVRPQFGNRFLTDEKSVFCHNAWDNVQWNKEQEEQAEKLVKANSKDKFNENEKQEFEKNSGKFWDSFYNQHQNKFFKDRHWLFTEFPELNINNSDPNCKTSLLEIGCGVGNTVIPLLQSDLGKHIFIYACDFSEKAISILKDHSLYNESFCEAFVLDVTSENWIVPFEKNSLDIVTMIFVLSAINPEKHLKVIRNVKNYLKPNGLILFRDYGRFDMAQLRFKNGRCLSDNFYARGDGTSVYFFTQDELRKMFLSEGFTEELNMVDRRLQVNRGKLLKMYRVWIQGKYRKLK